MKKPLFLNALVVLALLLAVVPTQAKAPAQARPAARLDAPSAQVQPPPPQAGGAGARPDPMSKLDNELRTLAAKGGQEAVTVYIQAKTGTDLKNLATVTEKRAYLGDELIVAKVAPDKLVKLASHPGVVAAKAFHAIEAPIPVTPHETSRTMDRAKIKQEQREKTAAMRAKGREGVAAMTMPNAPQVPAGTKDWYGVDTIGAGAAWAKGYTGEGVNIAIVDSGVDFGHPDLEGKQAVYESGPYQGWPIALDPRSMRQYYYNGLDAWDNYYEWWDYTWYAGVYDVLHCAKGVTTTFDFLVDPFEDVTLTFTIAPEIAALSKSGEIRWGVHPDEQLFDFVFYDYMEEWSAWIPFILLDTQTAGVYDTVIADLNFDTWFDLHDDQANKADPVLSQDLGAYLKEPTYVMTGTQYIPWVWGANAYPPTWWGTPKNDAYMMTAPTAMVLPAGAWVWAPNHWTPEGATTMQDGIADVSGGMIYYIADGKLPIPGMDYLYPGFGPGGLPPIPFNGQLVAFMLGSTWAGGGDHGTLCASAAVAGGEITDPWSANAEQVQYNNVVYPKVEELMPRVGIAGGNAEGVYCYITGLDPDNNPCGSGPDLYLTGKYLFVLVGDDYTYQDIAPYPVLMVSEWDNEMSDEEAEALVEYYDNGRPIILGMEDLDEADKVVQDAVAHIFGVTNARDGQYQTNWVTPTLNLNPTHPITRDVVLVDNNQLDADNDHFESLGATWVVSGTDQNYYVWAYDDVTVRSVIMGEALQLWYDAGIGATWGAGQLIRNSLDWVSELVGLNGTVLFYDDFTAGLGNWTATGLWHHDAITDPVEAGGPGFTFPPVEAPAAAFNHEVTGAYTGTPKVKGTLTLNSPVHLPEGARNIVLGFRSYEDVEDATRPITASSRITIGVVGANSAALQAQVAADWRLVPYTFIDMGDDFTAAQIVTVSALLVAESPAGLTVTETNALQGFYNAGKPIVLGMTDIDDYPIAQQNILNAIFGVDKARDGSYSGGNKALSDHVITTLAGTGGDVWGANYFLEDGAEWVASDDGEYYVLAYEGTARTVIMGQALNTWYTANSQLVSNSIIWAVEGMSNPLRWVVDPEMYDVRSVEISTDNGATWFTLWDSTLLPINVPLWHPFPLPIANYAGRDVRVRFGFDSVDDRYNDFNRYGDQLLGWYIDNVRIVAYGPNEYWKDDDVGTVQGPAPDAKIIAIGDVYAVVNDMQGIIDAYTFLAFGVDGKPNSGDEFVDIVSMSYGDGTVHNDGWDVESRLLAYYNQNYLPKTTLLSSSGNGGHGYGTVNSPKSPTLIAVGASTQYGVSDAFGGGLDISQINQGEVQPFSGRGPDAMGQPNPHVVANGAWGAGDTPVNLAYGLAAGYVPYPDGGNAWYEWGGTSRAGPEAAGVTALLYQAYYSDTAQMPDFETARQILMSGADDLNHDVLMQGAGRVNADRATDVAGGLDGIYVSPSLLAAGAYDGAHYEAFANVLYPGDTWGYTFTVRNTGSAAKTVNLSDEILMQTDVITYDVVVKPYTDMEDPYPDTYYYYANYFVQADSAYTGTTHGDDLVIPVPAGADLMQVQLLVPFEMHDFDYQDPNPDTISYALGQRWSLTVFDWTDRNGDGKLWEDANGDGIVNPQNYNLPEIVDISYLWPITMTEINRFAYSYNYANEQEVTVRLGDRDDIDNVVIGIVHRYPNDTREGWGEQEYAEHPLKVKVVFYDKTGWNLVSESPASLSVPAGGSATFRANFTIPATQAPGLYEGAIVLNDGSHTSLIPTTVNVAVPSDKLLFTLGGTAKAGTPYDNGRMMGGWTWSGVNEEGDWRFYYYDADSGLQQQYLYVRNQWGDLCGNMPTFNETLVWGPNPGDQFSLKEPAKFGPYGMQFAGGTPYANTGDPFGWGNPRVWAGWYNADNTPLPESRAWATLWDGLNQVQFRNVLLSGKERCGEGFEATAGVFGVNAPKEGIVVDYAEGAIVEGTLASSGFFMLDAVSPVDKLIVYPFGFGNQEVFRNQDVPDGKHPGEFPPPDLLSGWVHTFTVTNSSGIAIDTFGPWSSDIDLYLLYDANGDGLFNLYDNREFDPERMVSDAGGSNESIFFWGNQGIPFVADGLYAVVMYGYSVKKGDQFDLHLYVYGGDSLTVEGATPENNYVVDVTPGEVKRLKVNWEVPDTGVYQSYLLLAMPWEEQSKYWYQGPVLYVPVTINNFAVNLDASTKTVDKAMVPVHTLADDEREILTYLITLVNIGNGSASFEVRDLLPEGVSYYYQYVDEGPTGFTGTYVAKWWTDIGAHGYITSPEGDYIYLSGSIGPSYSNKVYIEYKVKVKSGFAGEITNKADISVSYAGYHKFLARKATTLVRYYVYLPAIMYNGAARTP